MQASPVRILRWSLLVLVAIGEAACSADVTAAPQGIHVSDLFAPPASLSALATYVRASGGVVVVSDGVLARVDDPIEVSEPSPGTDPETFMAYPTESGTLHVTDTLGELVEPAITVHAMRSAPTFVDAAGHDSTRWTLVGGDRWVTRSFCDEGPCVYFCLRYEGQYHLQLAAPLLDGVNVDGADTADQQSLALELLRVVR